MEQIKYKCETMQKDWTPLPPIPFTVQGHEGIDLGNAMQMNYSHLEHRDDPMFTDGATGGSISLRMEVRAHP